MTVLSVGVFVLAVAVAMLWFGHFWASEAAKDRIKEAERTRDVLNAENDQLWTANKELR